MPKTISPQLQTFLLDNTTFSRADLISIILPNGQVMNVLYGTNFTSITYPTGLPATLTIGGTCYPWSTADPNYGFAGSSGSAAVSLPLTQGQMVTLNYLSGSVSPHSGSIPVDASGGYGGSSASVPGSYITTPATPPPWCLIGGFANAAGWLVAPPFYIGNNATLGPAPLGATQLLMGVNDYPYSDNTGSWIIGVTAPTYYSSAYGAWERGPYTNEASFKLQSGSMKLTGLVPESLLYPGTQTPLMQVLNAGMLAGAKVIIQTLFWPTGSQPSAGFSMGTMQLMQGIIGEIKNTDRSKIECDVSDLTWTLTRPFPPHLIQTACRHSFCDPGCTLIINNFRTTAYALDASSTNLYLNLTIPAWAATTAYIYGNLVAYNSVLFMCTTLGTSGSSFTPSSGQQVRGQIYTDGSAAWTSMGSYAPLTPPTNAQGYGNQSFPLGYVLFTSGQNAGLKWTVKAQATSSGALPQLQLLKPLPFPVAAGDTIRIFAGCDKTLATCQIIYANQIHFGGDPFVPNPEVAS